MGVKYLTVKEYAELEGISVQRVYQILKQNPEKGLKQGKKQMVIVEVPAEAEPVEAEDFKADFKDDFKENFKDFKEFKELTLKLEELNREHERLRADYDVLKADKEYLMQENAKLTDALVTAQDTLKVEQMRYNALIKGQIPTIPIAIEAEEPQPTEEPVKPSGDQAKPGQKSVGIVGKLIKLLRK